MIKETDLSRFSSAVSIQLEADRKKLKKSRDSLETFDLAFPLHQESHSIIAMVDRHNAAVRRLMGANGPPENESEIEHWRSELLIARNFINKLAASLNPLNPNDPKLTYLNTRIRIAKSNLAKAQKNQHQKKIKQWEHYLHELLNQREVLIYGKLK